MCVNFYSMFNLRERLSDFSISGAWSIQNIILFIFELESGFLSGREDF